MSSEVLSRFTSIYPEIKPYLLDSKHTVHLPLCVCCVCLFVFKDMRMDNRVQWNRWYGDSVGLDVFQSKAPCILSPWSLIMSPKVSWSKSLNFKNIPVKLYRHCQMLNLLLLLDFSSQTWRIKQVSTLSSSASSSLYRAYWCEYQSTNVCWHCPRSCTGPQEKH